MSRFVLFRVLSTVARHLLFSVNHVEYDIKVLRRVHIVTICAIPNVFMDCMRVYPVVLVNAIFPCDVTFRGYAKGVACFVRNDCLHVLTD